MADRVYPSSKPNPPPPTMNGAATTANGTANGTAAGAKPKPPGPGQLYNPNRPRPAGGVPYRPNPRRSKRSSCSCRRFCCLCFIYTLIAILCLLLIAAIAASIFYVLYHPKHPTFSVLAVRISAFNLTTPSDPSSAAFSHLNSKIDFTVSVKNPNNKISFIYDAFAISVASSGGIEVGNASLPAFTHVPSNTTIVKGTVAGDPKQDLDSDSVSSLKSDLGKKNGFPLSVQMDTQVQVKMGKLSSKKVGIRVLCDGIRGFPPKEKTTEKKKKKIVTITPGVATISDAKCKVDLRIKIWKFTF